MSESGHSPSDSGLILCVKERGDQGAFNQLVTRYEKWLYGEMYRITLRHEDAEDLVQSTFLHVWVKKTQLQPTHPFRGWLLLVARRLAINRWRRGRKHGHSVSLNEGEGDAVVDQETVSNPLVELLRQDTIEAVRSALQRLNPLDRALVMLRYGENTPCAEIALKQEIPISVVYRRLFHARRELQGYLGEGGKG